MPKIVDYVDRFDDVRRAVFDLTLREGPHMVSMTSVAAQLGLSSMSVRRMMPDATRLSELGLQWIERQERPRLRQEFVGQLDPDHPWGTAWNPLLRLLPGDSEQADEARVWRALTVGFARTDWAVAAQNGHLLLLATRADRAVADGLPDTTRDAEVSRLVALVVGTTESVCSDLLDVREARPLVLAHLEERASAWLVEHGAGAL